MMSDARLAHLRNRRTPGGVRRAGTVVLALALAGAVVAGCSSDGDEADGDDPGATTTASTATTAMTAPGVGPADSAEPPEVRLTEVARFDQPVMLAPVPGVDGAFYVVEKEGRIRLLENGRPGAVALDIADDVSSGGERGLLGLAVAPDGAHLYLDYTDRGGDTRVVEYAIGRGGRIDQSSRRELLRVDQPFENHNGGHLEFGPDGMLYIALGDGGSGGDPDERAQDLGELLGKILRIDPLPGNDRPRYAVPEDNPFNGVEGARAEIWAYGLRNPWRFSFDRGTGTLWIGDVGQSSFEEVDRAPEGSKGGENYGWDRLEGRAPFEGDPPAEHVLPLVDYARDGGNCSVTGGRVYRGRAIPLLTGWYVFGDYCKGDLVAVRADATPPATPVSLGVNVGALTSFAEDGDGELFALSLDGGVYRIEG